jgi:response regulator RpfG family c-di-GMP phosphodiesterase
MSDEIFNFMDEDDSVGNTNNSKESTEACWKILISDDEPSIHDITVLALKDIEYDQRKIEFLHAYSAKETIELLEQHTDTALVLLDVVMESDDAGLNAVSLIRDKLENTSVRIILRTGQPGQAPEHDVIQKYDINDYKEKTELTSKKLFTTVITALRSYHDIMRLEQNRQGLEKIINATSNIFRLQSMEQLSTGVLMQVMSIIGVNDDAFYSHAAGFIRPSPETKEEYVSTEDMVIFSGTGHFENKINQSVSHVISKDIISHIEQARTAQKNIYAGDSCIVYLKHDSLIYINSNKKLDFLEQKLLDIFCANVSVAFENVELNDEILDTQKEIIFTLGATTEFRSKEAGNHIIRVAELSKHLAVLSGLPEDESELLKLAAPMHDVGKIGIPDSILLKPGKLTDEEYETMKTHTTIGFDLLKASSRPIFKAAAQIAHEHQERWNGSGYPRGLKGMDIHINARIISIVDVFDALASKRCYKDSWCEDDIINFFKKERGNQFDPKLIDLFLQNFSTFMEIRDQFED